MIFLSLHPIHSETIGLDGKSMKTTLNRLCFKCENQKRIKKRFRMTHEKSWAKGGNTPWWRDIFDYIYESYNNHETLLDYHESYNNITGTAMNIHVRMISYLSSV